MHREYQVIDAFTSEPYTGNPAAVVLDTDDLSDQRMQAVAAEFNLSETTFILPSDTPNADVRFRWFTPLQEVDLCGHATIAGVHALVEARRIDANKFTESPLRISTRSGTLPVTIECFPVNDFQRLYWLKLPEPRFERLLATHSKLASILNIEEYQFVKELPMVNTDQRKAIVFVSNFQTLNSVKPDFAKLAEYSEQLNVKGWCIATLQTVSRTVQVQSRFLAPLIGVDEDPVTGSAHGPLSAYLMKHDLLPIVDNVAGANCIQSKVGGRAGLVRALVYKTGEDRYSPRIAGQAVTTMRGVLVGE